MYEFGGGAVTHSAHNSLCMRQSWLSTLQPCYSLSLLNCHISIFHFRSFLCGCGHMTQFWPMRCEKFPKGFWEWLPSTIKREAAEGRLSQSAFPLGGAQGCWGRRGWGKEPRLLMSPLTSEMMPDSVLQDKKEPLWFQWLLVRSYMCPRASSLIWSTRENLPPFGGGRRYSLWKTWCWYLPRLPTLEIYTSCCMYRVCLSSLALLELWTSGTTSHSFLDL